MFRVFAGEAVGDELARLRQIDGLQKVRMRVLVVRRLRAEMMKMLEPEQADITQSPAGLFEQFPAQCGFQRLAVFQASARQNMNALPVAYRQDRIVPEHQRTNGGDAGERR